MSTSTEYNLKNYVESKLGYAVYPKRTPTNPNYPCLTYKRTSGTGGVYQSAVPTMRRETYEFTIYAKTPVQADELRDNLIGCLDGYNVDVFVTQGSETDDYDAVNDVYEHSVSFDVNVNATLPYFTPITGWGASGSFAVFTGPTTVTSSASPMVPTSSYAEFAKNAGTASYFVGFIESASYASYAKNAGTASYYNGSVVSSSYASTASFVQEAKTSISASHAVFAQGTPFASASISSSHSIISDGALFASSSVSASHADRASTASFVEFVNIANKPTLVSSSGQILNGTGIYSSSAQISYITASAATASYVALAEAAKTSLTASFVDYGNVANKPTLISSSAQLQDLRTGSFTGSFVGTASYADRAGVATTLVGGLDVMWATNASSSLFASSSVSASHSDKSISASYATTASFALNAGSATGGGMTFEDIIAYSIF